MSTKSFKLSSMERIFGAVFLLILFIVLSNYILLFMTGNNVVQNLEHVVISSLNESFNENKKLSSEYKVLTLKKNQSEDWTIYQGNNISLDYLAENKNGKILIKKRTSVDSKNFSVSIENVGSYFSRGNEILTDIPYNETPEIFFVAEQEDLFPIIGYHNVFTNEDDIVDPLIDMREIDFINQVHFLNETLNCRWIGLTEVTEKYILPRKKLPRNTCVMTFDDGRENNYTTVLPILKRENVIASFFIIAGRSDQKQYMNKWEVSSLYRAGNEIGSHTFTGGSLIDTSWYKEGPFTQEVLWDQLYGSKQYLNSMGYNVKMFAYPLGDYNENVISTIKESGYIAARESKKNNSWRDPRALSTSMDPEFIWHLNYYEPVVMFDEQLERDLSYKKWWQFEEGVQISPIASDSIKILSETKPTDNSFGVILMRGVGDSITNSFILENDGQYVLDILGTNLEFSTNNFTAYIDDRPVSVEKDFSQDCNIVNFDTYCHYILKSQLSKGEHFLKVINTGGTLGLDRFRVSKEVKSQKDYTIRVEIEKI